MYYLVATAGFPNFGDELILEGWLRYLAEVAPDTDVWVDTHAPGPTQVLMAGVHPRARFTDALWRLCWEAPSDNPWEVASWVQHALANPGMAPRWHQGIMLMHRAEVVHVVGGGYVNAKWPRHVGLLAGAAAAARHAGGRAVMTGQGLIPEPPGTAPLLRALADRFEIVDVRDRQSAELLGVHTGVDDAALMINQNRFTTPEQVWPDESAPDVMLCLQSDMNEVGTTAVAGAVLSMLRDWKVSGRRVCVVEAIPRIDREVYALIEHEVAGARFYPFAEVWEKGLPLSAAQTWITTRFHIHMTAAAAGAGGVAIPISKDYYSVKHRSLVELGSGWTLLEDLDQVPTPPRPGGFGGDVAAKLRQVKIDLAHAIYAPVAPHR